MRLGTSSPKMMVMKVIAVTTIAVAAIADGRSAMPKPCSQRASRSLNAASPTMPFSTAIEVIPTCTVDRKRVGCSSSRKAALAPPLPSSASTIRRALRLDASASSDIAKPAFSKVSSAISRKSMAHRKNQTRWHFT